MDGTVSGGAAKRGRGKKLFIVLLIVVVLVAVGVIGWLWYQQSQEIKLTASDKIALEDSKDQGYDTLTKTELAARAKVDVGKTLERLRTETFNVGSFSSFEKSYAAAQILTADGSHKQSVAVYKIAEKKATEAQKNRTFYQHFGVAAGLAGDKELTLSLLEKQLDFINRDTSLDDFQRQQQGDEIRTKIDAKKSSS